MKNNMYWIIFLLSFGLVVSLFFMQRKPPLYLMVNDITPVFLSVEDAMKLPKERAWKNLEPQQKVRVLSCIDVKHYLIYEVLVDGEKCFVNEGGYILIRNGKLAIC